MAPEEAVVPAWAPSPRVGLAVGREHCAAGLSGSCQCSPLVAGGGSGHGCPTVTAAPQLSRQEEAAFLRGGTLRPGFTHTAPHPPPRTREQ